MKMKMKNKISVSELSNEELIELNYELASEIEARIMYPENFEEPSNGIQLTPEEKSKLPF